MKRKFEFLQKDIDRIYLISRWGILGSVIISASFLIEATWFGLRTSEVQWSAGGIKTLSLVGLVLLAVLGLSRTRFAEQSLQRKIFESLTLFAVAGIAFFGVAGFLLGVENVIADIAPPMSTSTCLFLLCLAQFLKKSGAGRFSSFYQTLFLFSFFIELVVVLGFLFDQDSIHSLSFFRGTSIISALNCMICSLLLLFIEPRAGWVPILIANNLGSRLLRPALFWSSSAMFLLIFLVNAGTTASLYEYRFAFNLISVGAILVLGIALVAISMHLNRVDRNHKEAVAEIGHREKDLWNAQALSKTGSWVWNLETHVTAWSPQIYEIFGIVPGTPIDEQLLGSHVRPEALQRVRETLAAACDLKECPDFEYEIHRADGTVRFVRGRAELRMNSSTGQKEIHGILQDITESKRVMDQLSAAERLYSDLYNEAPDMLLSVETATGKVIKCNRTLIKKLGYSEEEVIGADVLQLYTEGSRQIVIGLMAEFRKVGSLVNQELVVLAKDGTTLDVSLSSSAVRDASGKIISSRSIWRDISEIKRAREMIIREKAAAEASQMKSHFIATISHEIRTPLNGIVGMSDILSTTPLNSQQADCVETLKQSADSLLNLVDDVLDFSKIESGKIDLSYSHFDFNQLISEVQRQSLWAADRKQLRLQTSVDGLAGLYGNGDPQRLKQILGNLVSNAIKFTEIGSVQLNATLLSREGDQAIVEFEVIDTGIGISEAAQSQLFRPFSQADQTIFQRYGGTGLGLSISQSLARLMGSEIRLESHLNIGSRFYFNLPIQVLAERRSVQRNMSVVEFEKNGPPKILVAEDVGTNRKVIGLMLENLGCEVIFAVDGVEAIELLAKKPVDLVFMDCQMPRLDGLGACRWIRSQGSRELAELPVVALTASAATVDRERCLSAGMSDFMSKPITMAALSEKLQKWLRLETRARGPGSVPKLPNLESLNSAVLDDLIKIDNEKQGLVLEILEVFEKKLPERLQNIQMAIREGNPHKIQREIHSLKSSGSSLGATAIGEACDLLARVATEGTTQEALNHWERLSSLCYGLSPLLQDWLSKRAA